MRLMRGVVARVLAVLLAGQTLFAAERSAVRTDWNGFREQVAQLKLKNRDARIGLTAGADIKALFVRAEENGVVVRLDRALRQWKISETEAMVPRDSVASVRFGGRIGHRGLIGGLAGLGLGAALGAAATQGNNIGAPVTALGAVAFSIGLGLLGYNVGHFSDRRAPSFFIVR
jgi:hypothetical protein